MEKTIVHRTNASEVNFELISATINNIRQFVKDNGYQFKDDKGFEQITEQNFNTALQNMSWKKRKKLAAYIWQINNHPTLEKVNKFFHFLMKTVLQSDARIRVIKSDKELAIQAKRKVYKQALEAAKKAYAEYKEEKGDFYKKQLAQKLAA